MDVTRHEDGGVPYPQPIEGGYDGMIDNLEEQVGYLPGTSCRIWYTYLSTCFPEHWHRALEIIVGENGYYLVEAEGASYEVHREDILIIPRALRMRCIRKRAATALST